MRLATRYRKIMEENAESNPKLHALRNEFRSLLSKEFSLQSERFKDLYGVDGSSPVSSSSAADSERRLFSFKIKIMLTKGGAIHEMDIIARLAVLLEHGDDIRREKAARSLAYLASDPGIIGTETGFAAFKELTRLARRQFGGLQIVKETVEEHVTMNIPFLSTILLDYSEYLSSFHTKRRIAILWSVNRQAREALESLGLDIGKY